MKISLLATLLILLGGKCSYTQVLSREWVSYYSGQLTNPNQIVYEPVENCVYIVGYTADDTGIATPGSDKDDIGELESPSFPPDISQWKSDFFLGRFDNDGNRIWSTYIGGDSTESNMVQIATDRLGNIYIAGQAKSLEGIATPGAYRTEKPVDTNLVYFLMKFAPDGEKLWGTYFDPEAHNKDFFYCGLAVDSNQNVYLSGITYSDTGISTAGTYQTGKADGYDGFVVRFDTDGNRLWGTYIGGAGQDAVNIVHIGRDGNLYIAGYLTSESGIGTLGTYQPYPLSGPGSKLYVMKMDPESGTRLWCTYVTTGGDMADDLNIISLDTDNDDHIYIYGYTRSEVGIATEGVHQESFAGGSFDAYIMKFDDDGSRLWGTYFGGEGTEWLNLNLGGLGSHWGFQSDIRVTEDDSKIYICGGTESATDIATPGCTYEPTTENQKGFIAEFNPDGQLSWGSYYDEQINSIDIARDNKGLDIYFTTRTNIYGLGTEGTHLPEMGDDLYSSGLLGKFAVSCPEYENNMDYAFPNLVSSLAFGTYTWYHNGVSVATTESAVYPIDGDTTGYWFCIAEACGCQYISDTLYFNGLGIHQPGDIASWSLYPNPATDELTLDFGRYFSMIEDTELRIVDVLGRNMHQKNIKKGTYQNITISVKELPPGIYILRLGLSGMQFIKQ